MISPQDTSFSFPAVIIGGPPHSGKSVLVYSLSHALRELKVPHYVLRACPDGEGDWANESEQTLVREIRSKGDFSQEFIAEVSHQLQRRHLPLIVDVGGKPKVWQEAVFAHCTHAFLLIGDRADDQDAFERDLAIWQEIMARQGVVVAGVFKSRLDGRPSVNANVSPMTGVLTGLERGRTVGGAVISAVANHLQKLFTIDDATMTRLHLAAAPAQQAISLPGMLEDIGGTNGRWSPDLLILVANLLSQAEPLAVYGRGPNWVYAFCAIHVFPAKVWLFDARLGWICPPELPLLPPGSPQRGAQSGWQVMLKSLGAVDMLSMKTAAQYLSLENPEGLPLYRPQPNRGLILDGKVPNWLLLAAVRQLAPFARWTAVFQPQLAGSVVVASNDAAVPVGHIVKQINPGTHA